MIRIPIILVRVIIVVPRILVWLDTSILVVTVVVMILVILVIIFVGYIKLRSSSLLIFLPITLILLFTGLITFWSLLGCDSLPLEKIIPKGEDYPEPKNASDDDTSNRSFRNLFLELIGTLHIDTRPERAGVSVRAVDTLIDQVFCSITFYVLN